MKYLLCYLTAFPLLLVKDYFLNNCIYTKKSLKKIESQNHRMVGVGRDLWRSSRPPPLPKQGLLQQAAQDLVQVGFEYLQRRRLHNPSGQPVPMLCHPQSKEVLPRGQVELPLLQFVPIASRPVAGHH